MNDASTSMAGAIQDSAPDSSARNRDAEFAILLEASEAAAVHSLDFEALMAVLAGIVRKIVDYEIYSVLVPVDGGELRIAYSLGFGEDLARSLRVPLGEGLTGKAFRTKATVRVDNVDTEPGYLRAIDSVRSELAVPLIARDQVVAVLDLQSARANAFDSRVSDMLELVASRFSLAIDISQLYSAQARQHSTLQTLQKVAQDFSQILRLEELLQRISTLVRQLMPYDAFAIYLRTPNSESLRHYFGVKFKERVHWTDLAFGVGLVGTAAAQREPVVVPDTREDDRYVESIPGIRSEVSIPLVLKNEVIGVLDLESVEVARFTHEDASTLMLLAPQIASAIENARLYESLERDLEAARALQRHMLPNEALKIAGIEIAARNAPASMVSGDFYDFYDRGDTVGILNGDVSGKGAAAALYAALASGLIRTAAQEELSPGAMLGKVNEWLVDRRIEARFLAALLAVWDAPRSRLTISAAGMPYPFVCRDGRLDRVRLEGVPLGLFRESVYDELAFDLRPGDLAVSISDGFDESVGHNGSTYGEQRLEDLLRAHLHESAETIMDRLFEDIAEFGGASPQSDDRTAVVLRVTG